jgi:NADH-quinone oxidoreductase subunit E
MSKQSQGSLTIVGAIGGGVFLVAIVGLMVVGGYTFSPALFLAFGVALVVSVFLFWAFHRPVKSLEPQRLTGRVPRVDLESGAHGEPAGQGSRKGTGMNGATTPQGTDDTSSDKGSADQGSSGEGSAGDPAPSGMHAASAPDTEADEADRDEAGSDTGGSAEEATIGTEPQRLHEPREGGPDDLKRIKGIGPKLEDQLNRMGVYHFDQMAAWSPSEVAWMDENLGEFRGRASRDDWVGQARQLSEGGETDFSQRVDDGEVYDKNT